MHLYADSGNLSIHNTGQELTFYVDGEPTLTVDLTSVDLITMIREA